MLKQNKFFSIISILGTALAIMMIMAIIVTDGIKNISVAPENNRHQTLYIRYSVLKDSTGGNKSVHSGPLEYDIIKEYILPMKTPEIISANSKQMALVGTERSAENTQMTAIYTDPAYWKFLSFSFLEGRTFVEEEFLSGVSLAVISESTAKQLFKGENAIGQHINIDFQPYRVIGIVKDVSHIFTNAHADIWMPYTSLRNIEHTRLSVMLLPNAKGGAEAIKEEIREIERKYNHSNEEKSLHIRGPEIHRMQAMDIRGSSESEVSENLNIAIRKIWFILIIIMLVPAINLSGLNLSRIKKRTPEIGVRKAFGAKRHVILIQVLCENLITSFVGGILGLLLSVFVIFQMKNWLLNIPEDSAIPFSAIISIPVVISVFAACIIINILSAAIPAYRASRMTIANSITNNDKTS